MALLPDFLLYIYLFVPLNKLLQFRLTRLQAPGGQGLCPLAHLPEQCTLNKYLLNE